MARRAMAVGGALVLVAGLAACGGDDDGGEASGDVRTIEIDMVDNAFEPDTIEVEQGETVRFAFANRGELAHDAFIGDADAQAEHEADMEADDGHGGEHGAGEDDAVTIEPGEEGELTYTFDRPGTLEIGCHQPGHYEAGMTVTVEVA